MSLTTGSRLGRAMECVGSAIIPRISEETEHGIAGRWKHAFIEAVKNGEPLENALNVVPPEYREACESLDASAVQGFELLSAELELCYDVRKRTARKGIAPDATGFDDIYARTDLGGVIDDVACAIDVKTGRHDVEPAKSNWQLKVAALALRALHSLSTARVAVLYLREGQRARWDIADLDALDLDAAAAELEQLADRVSRIRKKAETPPVRTGEWCKWCPSKLYCPAHTALIRMFVKDDVAAVGAVKSQLTPELAREAKAQADLVRNALRNLDNALYTFARENGGIPLGNGRVWGPRVVQRDELDSELSYKLLRDSFGVDVAAKASTFDVTKKGIKDAMRLVQQNVVDAGGEKPTLVELERSTFGALRSAGAIKSVEKEVFEEHTPNQES